MNNNKHIYLCNAKYSRKMWVSEENGAIFLWWRDVAFACLETLEFTSYQPPIVDELYIIKIKEKYENLIFPRFMFVIYYLNDFRHQSENVSEASVCTNTEQLGSGPLGSHVAALKKWGYIWYKCNLKCNNVSVAEKNVAWRKVANPNVLPAP